MKLPGRRSRWTRRSVHYNPDWAIVFEDSERVSTSSTKRLTRMSCSSAPGRSADRRPGDAVSAHEGVFGISTVRTSASRRRRSGRSRDLPRLLHEPYVRGGHCRHRSVSYCAVGGLRRPSAPSKPRAASGLVTLSDLFSWSDGARASSPPDRPVGRRLGVGLRRATLKVSATTSTAALEPSRLPVPLSSTLDVSPFVRPPAAAVADRGQGRHGVPAKRSLDGRARGTLDAGPRSGGHGCRGGRVGARNQAGRWAMSDSTHEAAIPFAQSLRRGLCTSGRRSLHHEIRLHSNPSQGRCGVRGQSAIPSVGRSRLIRFERAFRMLGAPRCCLPFQANGRLTRMQFMRLSNSWGVVQA